MAVRLLGLLPVFGAVLAAAGCSGFDRSPSTAVASPIPHARSFPATQTGPRSDSPLAIRPATFAGPAENHAEITPDRQPVPLNNSSEGATVRPRTVQKPLHRRTVAEDAGGEPAVINLDLTRALVIAGGRSPQIAFAAARCREAYARLEAARTLWLPSIRAGVSFNHHDGTLQESRGAVLDVSRSSLQAGLGIRAVGAGTPAVPGVAAEFHAADAIFQPRIAAYAASGRNAATQTALHDTLLATALAYLDLLREAQQLRIAEETRDNAQKLAMLTAAFATTGQGSQADADRAQTELARRCNDVSRAQEAQRVAAARLAELLSIDPTIEIAPLEPTVAPIDLVTLPEDITLPKLVAMGLANRPELAEAQHLVCEAVHRYRREKYACLVPSVLLGVSQSEFGGGFGSNIDNDRNRFDFDAAVYWELRNFGLGDRAKRDERGAQYDQAVALQARMMDRVAREVVEAATQVTARKSQMEVAESGIQTATDSYRRNTTRIREGQGLPIEALQSLQALDEARREYLRTIVDYDEAQFRLQRALGWPVQ